MPSGIGFALREKLRRGTRYSTFAMKSNHAGHLKKS